MDNKEDIEQLLHLNRQLSAVELAEKKEQLILYINHLLVHDFSGLVQILYRVDVNEEKLKNLLQQNSGTDAAIVIAELLLQRQEEKLKTKESLKPGDTIAEEDKW